MLSQVKWDLEKYIDRIVGGKMNNSKINEGFILLNPKEIYEFVSLNKKFIELINISFNKIKEYFPYSKVYLKFFEDPYDKRGNCIFADIYNPSKDFNANYETYLRFSKDFDFISKYGYFEYYINVISDDENYKEISN